MAWLHDSHFNWIFIHHWQRALSIRPLLLVTTSQDWPTNWATICLFQSGFRQVSVISCNCARRKGWQITIFLSGIHLFSMTVFCQNCCLFHAVLLHPWLFFLLFVRLFNCMILVLVCHCYYTCSAVTELCAIIWNCLLKGNSLWWIRCSCSHWLIRSMRSHCNFISFWCHRLWNVAEPFTGLVTTFWCAFTSTWIYLIQPYSVRLDWEVNWLGGSRSFVKLYISG